jgi:hypothetical protein
MLRNSGQTGWSNTLARKMWESNTLCRKWLGFVAHHRCLRLLMMREITSA